MFKLWGQTVNIREQQDAFDFFQALTDQIDEHLKVREITLGKLSIYKMYQRCTVVVCTLCSSYIDQIHEHLNARFAITGRYSTRNVIFYKINDRIGLTHDTIEYTHDRTRFTHDTIGLIYDRIA